MGEGAIVSHVHGKAEKAEQNESGGEVKGTSREAKMGAIKPQRKEPTHKLPWVVRTFWFMVHGSWLHLLLCEAGLHSLHLAPERDPDLQNILARFC